MSELPVNLTRETKSIHQTLKELLKIKEPFDKEVDFQRKNLRRRYLNLLLVHPYAKESKDVENHLWMQTSYAFIAAYKQRITALDRIIQNNARQQPQPQQHQRQNGHGPVEYRKLIQRFRQFLAEEEKFWTLLVNRLRRSFALNEVNPALLVLGIISSADDTVGNSTDSTEVRDGIIHASNGRNHFQFPPEDASISVAPTTPAEREGRLAIVSKALICLGDIARYRELYNEAGGRPRAGHEDAGPTRRGRNRRGGQTAVDVIPRPRNYDKAQQCYEQARLLMPTEGNPSHQLAILASYQKDLFGSLVHYYRALCVRQPYDTAAENMGTILSKALEQAKNRSRREREKPSAIELPPRVRIDLFKEKIVVLHATWKVGMEKGMKKMESVSPFFPDVVYKDFLALVSERHLPIDMISNAIVLSQGALWKHRMIRDSNSSGQDRKAANIALPSGTSVIVEWLILNHLLDLHCALLEVGKDELRVPPPFDAAESDLAQRITATFRRTLPALRIASKWLRANFKYMLQDQEYVWHRETDKNERGEPIKRSSHMLSAWSSTTRRFWLTYSEFLRALSRAFPAHKLPSFTSPLEEDIEMRGFLPLKKMMGETASESEGNQSSVAAGQAREQVHPNVEQLMRIADLLNDGSELTKFEHSPLRMYGGQIVFDEDIIEAPTYRRLDAHRTPSPSKSYVPRQHKPQFIDQNTRQAESDESEQDDNMTEVTSRTDDDVVRDAFRFLDTSDRDAEEVDAEDEEIVWDPRVSLSPVISPNIPSPTSNVTPMTPVKSKMSPIGSSRSPSHHKAISSSFTTPIVPAVTTAQDLLDDVISGRIGGGMLPQLETALPQPALLFGSEMAHLQGHNIWSASRDEQSLKFTGQSNPIHQSRPLEAQSPQAVSQSMWPSSYSDGTQNSQRNLAGTLPSAPFAHQPQPIVSGTHQRVPSASIGAAQLFSHQAHHGPFGYPTSSQQPIQRPDAYAHLPASYLTSSLAPGNGLYGMSPLSGYHSRHLSLHDPHQGQNFTHPTSQVWGNTG